MILKVAELSYNHHGDDEILKTLIGKASEAGATHIKFEKRAKESYTEFKSNKQLFELSDEQIDLLIEICKKFGLGWFCSVRDISSANAIAKFKPKKVKIASREAHSLDFIASVIKIFEDQVEYVISTGGLTLEQIQLIHDLMDENQISSKLTLVHCVSKYPHSNDESNINRIKYLKQTYACKVGYSGHESGIEPSIFAAILGVSYIERHLALDQTDVVKSNVNYTDEKCTLTPTEFQQMCKSIDSFVRLKTLPLRDIPLDDELNRLRLQNIR
ncbi:MAG: N-acetylneuraminate synthase family protein [Reichenbachiella sp.]|uniref:N-acetylneuraminate synthase family protein n=1 Tax=Reichenbachiella sp. TaxID=2184521 RepID=UPI003266EA18